MGLFEDHLHKTLFLTSLKKGPTCPNWGEGCMYQPGTTKALDFAGWPNPVGFRIVPRWSSVCLLSVDWTLPDQMLGRAGTGPPWQGVR